MRTVDPEMSVYDMQDQSYKSAYDATLELHCKPAACGNVRMQPGGDIASIIPVGNGRVNSQKTPEASECARNVHSTSKRNSILKRISTVWLKTSISHDLSTIKHDATATAELSIGNRKAACTYNHRSKLLNCQAVLRTAVALLISYALGFLIFALLLYVHTFSIDWAFGISVSLTLVMNFALIIFPHARCVAALMSASVFTGQGRAALLSLVPGLLLAGPILNMQRNTNEGAASIGCLAELVFNHTTHLYEEVLNTTTRQIHDLVDLASETEKNFTLIKNKLRLTTVNSTVENIGFGLVGASGENEDQSLESANKICTRKLQRLRGDCQKAATRTQTACFQGTFPFPDYTSISGHPNRKTSCSSLCDGLTPTVFCAHFQANWNSPAKRTRRSIPTNAGLQELDELLSFRVNSSRVVDVSRNSSFNPVQKIRDFQESMKRRFEQVVFVVKVINKILVVFLILALVNACLYLRGYLKNLKHDNIYVTSKLKSINRKRELGTETLFPLQSLERKKYIKASSFTLTNTEAKAWRIGLIQVILHCIISGLFVLVDYGLYYLLLLVQTEGAGEVILSGGAVFDIDIDGEGPIAQLFRATATSLSGGSKTESVLNFSQCLPNPSGPSVEIGVLIVTLYCVAIAFVFFNAYGLRMRCKIAAFFFPDREQERVQFLYQRILKNRQLHADTEMAKF